MSSQSINMFASNYPKKQRTPLQSLPLDEYKTPATTNIKNTLCPQPNEIKRFLSVLIITILATFVFSSFFFTVTDRFFYNIGVEMFSSNGQPSILVTILHSVMLFFLVYITLLVIKC